MALSCLILFIPHALTTQDNTVNHSLLMVLMFGIMIGFIHGVGFKAQSVFIGYMLSPLLAWPLMIVGVAIILNKIGLFS